MDSITKSIMTEIDQAGPREAHAYLVGAARDGTFNRTHRTMRIAQADVRWLEILRVLVLAVGSKSWMYREGRSRSVWILETSFGLNPKEKFSSPFERVAFVRGYFDAEGGIPGDPAARFYVQFVQKDRQDLETVRQILGSLGITCGAIHNPSARVDPEYWRFYVLARSHGDFTTRIRSWHPRKRQLLEARCLSGLGDS